MNKRNIPLVDLVASHESIKDQVDRKILEVVSSGRYFHSPYVESFEKAFAKFIGTKFCIGVSSGTEALHLSLLALNIGPGDEVILPANTFVATAYAVIYVGAKPVLVDVDIESSNIDVNLIESKINKNTRAIIPVHLYGQPAEMGPIMRLAKKYKLSILEDACQSHGAVINGKKTGSIGELGTFSFYPAKNLGAYGDAGAITTNSPKFAKKIKMLREYGSNVKYKFDFLGFNDRLDAIQAVVLETKLKNLENWNKKRLKIAGYYDKRFKKELPFITIPKTFTGSTSVYHLYVIQVSQREKLMKYLVSKGVYTGIHYPIPLHLQKSLSHLGYKKGDFPVSEKLSYEILSLPMYPELTQEQQDYVVDSIKEFYNR